MTTNLESIKAKLGNRAEEIFLYDYPRRDQEDLREYLRRTSEIIELGAWETAIASAIFILEAIMPLMSDKHRIDFETKESDRDFAQLVLAIVTNLFQSLTNNY